MRFIATAAIAACLSSAAWAEADPVSRCHEPAADVHIDTHAIAESVERALRMALEELERAQLDAETAGYVSAEIDAAMARMDVEMAALGERLSNLQGQELSEAEEEAIEARVEAALERAEEALNRAAEQLEREREAREEENLDGGPRG